MGYVFISYSRTDTAYADRLATHLVAAGIEVWIDRGDIQIGARYRRTIRDAINNCDAFILIMSPAAEDSTWVENELDWAEHQTKPIYTLLLKGRPWFGLTSRHYEDVTNGNLPSHRLIGALPANTTPDTPELDATVVTLLTNQAATAHQIGESGNARQALELHQALLPDMQRVLGNDHPTTLTTRHRIARWTGEAGDPGRAIELYQTLLPDMQRVLGNDHPTTLITRHRIARWTSRAGDPGRALELYQALLPDRQRVLGNDHPHTLNTRANIAYCTGETGNPGRALELFQALLPDVQRALGNDHPHTLNTRANIARWTGETGNPGRALELFHRLLPDVQRVLGNDSPITLDTRAHITHWEKKRHK